MKALIVLSILSVLSLASRMLNLSHWLKWLLPVGFVAAIALNFTDWNTNASFFSGMLRADNTALAFTGVLLLTALLLVLLAPRFYDTLPVSRTESYAQQLFGLCGAVCMVGFGNLSMLFIGIELLSISSYVLAGSDKQNLLSNEAALKYFLMGSFASGFLLFGITLIYAVTGSFDTNAITQYAALHAGGSASPLFYGGIALLLIAMSFKASVAPFHFWAPDVYDGSPTNVTMFMALVVKTAAFGAFLRLFACFLPLDNGIAFVISLLAVLSMTIGNLSAIWQSSFKRLLAYSGIAHAGYLMLGILTASSAANTAVLYYSVAYSAASLAAFAVLLLIDYQYNTENRDSFKGLAKQNPFLAVVITISMLSLAGIPPTAGFFGKYYLFSLAVQAGYTWVVVLAVINSIISIFYYFSVLIALFADKPDDTPIAIPTAYKVVLAITTAITLVLGCYPSLLLGVL